jgi:hypothetical protein
MVESARTSVVLRPTRSPKWPKSAEPIGLAIKAMAKVASEASVAAVASGGKEQLGEDDDRGGGINIEVEELDGSADETGEEHLRGLVPLLFFAGHELIYRCFRAGVVGHNYFCSGNAFLQQLIGTSK